MKQILVFILFATMLCWFMFAPVYKHVIIVRQAVLQKEVDYLLEIGANGRHGYINSLMIQESRDRMAERGFVPGELVYMVDTNSGVGGMDANARLARNRIEFENDISLSSAFCD